MLSGVTTKQTGSSSCGARGPSSRYPVSIAQCRRAGSFRAGIFRKAGQFPAAESIDIPLSDEAQRFYKNRRHPATISSILDRDTNRTAARHSIPLAVLLFPFFKFLPQLYGWTMRSKITGLYNEMRSIEREMETQGQGQDADAMIAKLDHLDQRRAILVADWLRRDAIQSSSSY